VAPSHDEQELGDGIIENPTTAGCNEPIKQAWVGVDTPSTRAEGAPPPYDQIGESWKKEGASVVDNPHIETTID